ncbi:hypothetical protein F443_11666 [Phytophthora nicotianae P1569]|uniref:DUF7869 domain-containing protein n=1 Tax=Phytophthora nicotianae P1569 TaxID=1317065 RepID=V9EVT7_PHYNI|nr:hypothetical protein F443_11666 [Phytophthora nicotianae P1569]
MLRQLPRRLSPPLSPSQDVAATPLSACDFSAVTPSDQENTAPAPSQERATPVSNQDDVHGDESEEDEDEPLEDSDDEDWGPDDDPDDVKVVIGESAGSEVEEDISINLIENDVRQCVTDLITGDECEMGCLKGKSRELEWLMCSLGQMTKSEKTTCILTLVGVLMQTGTATRRRGKGERQKRRVREGNIAPKEHGKKLNKNASSIDAVWLVKWFKEFAAEVDEVVPVRVRTQKTKDSVVNKYYSREDYTLLPATFTWNVLHEEMHKREYKKDRAAVQSRDEASSDLAVIVMDFVLQNMTIPSVTCTPSQWYFCSLLAVNVYGIFFKNTGTQTNYVYDEFTSGKGSDQINSMLQHFIRTVVIPYGKKHLVVYADNCTGQNKNNHVIEFFVALVHMGFLERVDYKFFVKGHTKNSCDRGFGHVRKHVSRQDCWTMDHIIFAVNNSATFNTTVHISRGSIFFKSYKPVVSELYKNLTSVQQYQVLSMVNDQPGVVLCRKGPDNKATRQDLRRNVDGVATDDIKVDHMFAHFWKT